MYCRNASECHLPIRRICASENPRCAASDAAPMRKLCDLYLPVSRSQKLRTERRSARAIDVRYGLDDLSHEERPWSGTPEIDIPL